MPALESRYDQDASTASSEEDFVNASPPRSAGSGVARVASRASQASSGGRSRRSKAHTSSSSESTDSEEERELHEELADAGGDLEAGVVRGAPVEGRVERVMRSIGKGASGGTSSSQRYNAVGREDSTRRHKKKDKRSSSTSRRSGGMYALGKDDPSVRAPAAADPYANSDADLEAGDSSVQRSSTRSSKKSSKTSSSSKKGSSKKGSSKKGAVGMADPDGFGDDPSPPAKPRRRMWCYLLVALVVIIVIAVAAFFIVKLIKDKKSTSTEAHSEAPAASDAISSAASTAPHAASATTTPVSHDTATGTATDVHAATVSSTGTATDSHAASGSLTLEDGQSHPAMATSAGSATSADDGKYHPSNAASSADPMHSQIGEWGSVGMTGTQTNAPGATNALTVASPLGSSDPHATPSSGSLDPHAPAGSASGGMITLTPTSADVFAQTTMPPGISVPSATPSTFPGQHDDAHSGWNAPPSSASDGAHSPQDLYSAAVSSLGDSAVPSATTGFNASVPLGVGPVVVTTPLPGHASMSMSGSYGGDDAHGLSSSGAAGSATETPGAGWAVHSTPTVGNGLPGSATPSQATTTPSQGEWHPSATASQGEWHPSATPAPGVGGWNPDGTPVVAATGPYAAASVYQATAPEPFQTLRGNGTYFEASQHYGPCGVAANKTDFVVALSNAMWLNSTHGSTTTPSSYCGNEVLLTNLDNGLSIKAWVTERCAYCVGDSSLDLSVPVFSALSNDNLDAGVVNLIWGFTGYSSSTNATAADNTAASSSAIPSVPGH